MAKKNLNPNAVKALEQMKLEIANELGVSSGFGELNPTERIFTAGAVGGQMTRNLVEMGQKGLIDKEK